MRKRILVICMFDSIHSARWLSQFQDQDIEFLLFPSSPHRRIHKNLKSLVAGNSAASYKLFPLSRLFGLPLWIADKLVDNWFRSSLVKRAIKTFKPDFVHAMELQNAGYIAAKAMTSKSDSKLIATNWGSDIFWFQQFPKHRDKLKHLLSVADYYSCECNRDVALAKSFGFQGHVMPVIPNAGGFSREVLDQKVPLLQDRRVIAIKGYHGWVGRAKVALEAVEAIASDLEAYRLVVYSANRGTIKFANQIARRTGSDITVFGKGKLSHNQVLELFASAKIYVGLSLSDGISTSLLESMAMGAIPVQTATACCDEWFTDSGVKVTEITVPKVQEAILAGLKLAENQSLSDKNREIIRTKANAEDVAKIAQGFYNL
ncbi:MAG: glycosyltransferase [Aquiluna sp.]|nr:glycosyltransferase [Aquiluna sp.]